MTNVVVVGAGVFGTWTAHHLHAAGMQVTLVDAYGPGNSRSSSGDESRILRCGYGPDAIYSQMAWRSLALWRELQARLGAHEDPIWHQCGVLWMAAAADPYAIATRETLDEAGLPVTMLDGDELRARYPQLCSDGIEQALLEPECGVLMARRAVRTLCAEMLRDGVRFIRARVSLPWVPGKLTHLHLDERHDVAGDVFVLACGAWLPVLLPRLLGGIVRPTRQVVVYFGTPAGDDRFGPSHTPAFVDFASGIYGVPDLEGRGMKVGIDSHGQPIDPDEDDRSIDQVSIARIREWLRRRFPAMADAPVVEGRVCQYENTATGDFLIDRHPEHDNVWIVGGGSGHGFKHGPAVGEYVARLIATRGTPEPRFSLASKSSEPRRAIF